MRVEQWQVFLFVILASLNEYTSIMNEWATSEAVVKGCLVTDAYSILALHEQGVLHSL